MLLDSWKPSVYPPTKSHPWDNAIRRAKFAQRDGELKGILWHQGESDSNAKLAESYEGKLQLLISQLRETLEAPKVPFVIGQLGQFDDVPWDAHRSRIDSAHQSLARTVPKVGFVSSKELKHGGDKIHFDAASFVSLESDMPRNFFRVQSK